MKFKTRQSFTEISESELQLLFSGNLGEEMNLKGTREVGTYIDGGHTGIHTCDWDLLFHVNR